MKTVKTFAIMTVAGLTLLFAACSETESIDESLAIADKSAEMSTYQGDTCTYDDEITEADIQGLLLMREEEKLAHDVYSYFYNTYGESLFQSIANSEASHANAVATLMAGYGIEDPTLEGEGEFNNSDLPALYASLIAEGEKGLAEALIVGATIEDLDISDLKELLSGTENSDLIRVYENLQAGSENHLRAFVRALSALGETYQQQYITQEEYEGILAGGNSKGYGSQGSGQGGYGNQSSGQNGTGSESCDGTQTASGSGTGNAYGNRGSNGNGAGN